MLGISLSINGGKQLIKLPYVVSNSRQHCSRGATFHQFPALVRAEVGNEVLREQEGTPPIYTHLSGGFVTGGV